MSWLGPEWAEGSGSADLARWSAAAAIVVSAHAAAVAGYLLLHQPNEDIGDLSPVVTVELSPIDSVSDSNRRDLVPGAEDMVEQKPVPEADKEPERPKVEEPPPPTVAEQADAVPEQKPPERLEKERPPAPRTTTRVQSGAPRVEPTWQAVLLRHLENYKRYPQSAQAQGEQGIAVLRFTVDRDGRVLEHRIVQSSSYADLDNEAMAMIERAQPLPAFPPSMTESKLDLTVPIRFSLH
jgi:periplasmic protein TonB